MDKQAIRYHTAMSGEFFVAAQLQRQCVSASVTYGNAKSADVVVFDHFTGKALVVEVKTSSKGRWPVGSRVPEESVKPWVFVHLPEDAAKPPEFFVMTQSDMHKLLNPIEQAYLERYRTKHGKDYGDKPGVAAMTKQLASKFENNWNAIFNQLRA